MSDWDDGATCHSVGINGNCGLDCPVLLRGDCDTEDEMHEREGTTEPDQYYAFDKAMETV